MPRVLNLKERHTVVQDLWSAVNEGDGALDQVPRIVKAVLETEAWREREWNGRVIRNKSFREFIEVEPVDGCGWDIAKVRNLLRFDAVALTEYEAAIVGKPGGQQGNGNASKTNDRKPTIRSEQVNLKQDRGRAYDLRRLAAHRPDLHERVCAGELSANRAAIEAGFRKQPTPMEQVQRIIPKLTHEERRQLIELLQHGGAA